MDQVYSVKSTCRLTAPLLVVLFLSGALRLEAQDIRMSMTLVDNVGNSGSVTVGINPAATDGVDAGLGEAVLASPPPPAGTFDLRLIDNDLRSPSLLGNGVTLDLRGIYGPPPLTYVHELRVRRSALATTTSLQWALPLQAGITGARLVSYPDTTLLSMDMTAVSQVVLPPGVGRYMVHVTYGGPTILRHTLVTAVDPIAVGGISIAPNQPDYAPGSPVLVTAYATDTCWRFSHWSGDATGSLTATTIVMNGDRSVTAHFVPRSFAWQASALAPFVVNPGAPPPQTLVISNAGIGCQAWTASASEPWIALSTASGSGNGTIDVSVDPSALPCPGTHQGFITLTSAEGLPTTLTVPVTVYLGTPAVSARTMGAPVLLGCQPKANDLIVVTIDNAGVQPVTFPTAPVPGAGFVLKNAAAFPLTVQPADSAQLFFEFAPLAGQSGVITDNMVLNASTCGRQVLVQISGTRIAPPVVADVQSINFGMIYECAAEPLPTATITLRNNWPGVAQLRVTTVTGDAIDVVSAPATLAGGATDVIVLQPQRLGPASFSGPVTIEADYGVCTEVLQVQLTGMRSRPSFRAEAATTPGFLPPQVFDSVCVGGYSPVRSVRVINDGTAPLTMSLAVPPPFEIDGFLSTFVLAPGQQRMVNLRFHPVAAGTFSGSFDITADRCALAASVTLTGSTFAQQVLATTVTPATVRLGNCDSSARVRVSIANTGTSPVTFTTLPALPSGFAWDGSVTLPIVIPANPSTPFEAFVTFRPPIGQGGSFGGSVQWFGDPCGTGAYFTLDGERELPQVAVSTLDTFFVSVPGLLPQTLHVAAVSGAGCYRWTARADKPWIVLSRSSGTGDDSTDVSILTSAIPCQGTHAGTITITLEGLTPVVLEVPVIAVVGSSDLAVVVTGSPVILGCQTKANDLISVTVFNNGGASVTFPTAPALGSGFVLRNPGAFPLVVAARDSATFFVEFVPTSSQRGIIVENTVLSTGGCGSDLLLQLSGTRIAPLLMTSISRLDFHDILYCEGGTLPTMTVGLTNAHAMPVALRYAVPQGLSIVSAPATLAAGASDSIVVRPVAVTTADLAGTLAIEADYGVCIDTVALPFEARVRVPAMRVEALATPGSLPPQVFDTTCVGAWSAPRMLRISNTGSSVLRVTVTMPPPFETDAWGSLLLLQPGEHRDLAVRFHPTTAGSFVGNLIVAADQCALSSTVALQGVTAAQQVLRARVAPDSITLVSCEPDATVRLTVTNTGVQTAVFTTLPDLPAGFMWDPSITLPITIAPDSTRPFETLIRFAPTGAGTNRFGGSVQWFGDPCGTSVYFTLSGERVQPRLATTPGALDFGTTSWCGSPTQRGPRRTLTLVNTSTLPMHVNVQAPVAKYALNTGPVPFPQTGMALAAGASLLIDVEELSAGGGRFADTLFVVATAGTSGSCEQRLRIPMTGERYLPSFVLREDAASADFGDVCMQTTVVRSFVIENTGDKALTVRGVPPQPNAPFQLLDVPLMLQLAPGERTQFRVRFAPVLLGPVSAAMAFVGDACGDTVRFPLRGRGVQPSFTVSSIVPAGEITALTCERPGTRRIVVTVSNTGADPATIADAGVPPVGFIFDPPGQFPFRLQPGETHDISLRLVATDPGRYGGVVTLRGSACASTASFTLEAQVLAATYDIPQRAIAFGDIFVCSDGSVRLQDQERLTRSFIIRNTGDVPMTVRRVVTPLEGAVDVIMPGLPVFSIPPGMTQQITLALRMPIDSMTSIFAGAVDLEIARDSACPLEYVSIPFDGRVLRVAYGFAQDSLLATASCITRPVDMQARLVNEGSAPVSFSLALANATGFRLVDTVRVLSLPPRSERLIDIRYMPDSARVTATGTLIATDLHCGLSVSLPIRVDLVTPRLELSLNGLAPVARTFEARPGDVLDVPVYIDSTVACATGTTMISFDMQFDVFALAPLAVSSPQGVASLHRTAPDRAVITIANAALFRGELARIKVEVLVGPTAQTSFTVGAPRVQPPIAIIDTGSAATAIVKVLPRNGITTLADLGITSVRPPKPNLITGETPSTTSITVEVVTAADGELAVYDQRGTLVRRVHAGAFEAGVHTYDFDTATLPNGLYFVTLRTGHDMTSQKLILAR
jgi:hypothetical protein